MIKRIECEEEEEEERQEVDILASFFDKLKSRPIAIGNNIPLLF